MPNIQLNNSTLYYDTHGSGPTLVLIHAGVADSRMWDDQIDNLSNRFQLIRFDMRGYGKTAVSDHDYTNHDDLHILLNHLNIEKAHLLGLSRGGSVAVDFALSYPDQTGHLITCGSVPFGYAWGDASYEPPQWQALLAAFKQDDYETAAELDVQIWVDGPKRKPADVPAAIREKIREMDLPVLQQEKVRTIHEKIMEPKAATRLAELTFPTLLLCGDIDDPDLVKAVSQLHPQLPNAQKRLIPNTAHFPNMEQPTRFNQIVLDFLPS